MGMDHSPIRQTFELGKFISTAGKSIRMHFDEKFV